MPTAAYAYTLDNSNPAVNALNDGQTLTDAFTYQISDGHGGTSSAALTVTIRGTTDTPANTPPTAVAMPLGQGGHGSEPGHRQRSYQ